MIVQIMPSLPCLTGTVAQLQPPGRASPRYHLEPPRFSNLPVNNPPVAPQQPLFPSCVLHGLLPTSFAQEVSHCPSAVTCAQDCRKPSSKLCFFAQACCCALGCG